MKNIKPLYYHATDNKAVSFIFYTIFKGYSARIAGVSGS